LCWRDLHQLEWPLASLHQIRSDLNKTSPSRHGWPGDVRELRKVVETTVALAESGLNRADDLPDEVRTPTPGSDRSNDEEPPPVAGDLREAERQAILTQVRNCGGNLTQAARHLGIARTTLYLRLAKYGDRPALDELTRSTIGRQVGRLSEAWTAAVQYDDRQIS
jgi:transcriptional regulator of acetoin/glycerol metabolism